MNIIDETKKVSTEVLVDKLSADLDAKLEVDSNASDEEKHACAEAVSKLVDAKARADANDIAKEKITIEAELRTRELDIKLKELETSFKLAEKRAESEVNAAIAEAKATKFAATMDAVKSIAGTVGTVVCTCATIIGGCLVMKASLDASGEDRVVDKNKVQAARDAVNTFFKFRM